MLANSRRIREHTKTTHRVLASVGIDQYLQPKEGQAQ
jgi:hypothetical protein